MTEYFLAGINGKSFEMNLLIIDLWKKYPQYFNDDIKISALFGSFDNCVWNGGRENRNWHTLSIEECSARIKQINDLGISVRYTFTQPFVTEDLLSDYIGNKLMEIANNGMNGVILASDILFKYLKEKYPNFHYVYSTTNCSQKLEDYINDYDISVLDYRLNKNKDFINSIKDKSKIEILVDDCCPSCEYRKQHFENIGKFNLGQDININCLNQFNYGKYDNPKNFFESLVRTLENSLTCEEVEEYKKMGFNKFKLTGRSQGRKFLLDSYIYYLVKPQYRYIVKRILQSKVKIKLYEEK
jgi:collagenase-like PrtC family protease